MDSTNVMNGYEQEIDLKDLMFAVLHKWKPVIAVAVIFALLLGGAKGFLTYRGQSSPEAVETQREAYEVALQQYEIDKESYERQLENLTADIESQQDYLESSILMNMSPYDVNEAKADLFIRTDYEIMPGMVYQNVDYTDTIIRAYQSVITSSAFLEEIAKAEDMKAQYLQELVQVERGSTVVAGSDISDMTNLLTISVTHTERKQAEAILDDILDRMDKLQKQVEESIGAHAVTVVNQSSGSVVDLDLATKQDDESKRLDTLRTTLTDKQKAMNALVKPAAAPSVANAAGRSAIKYGVLGGVLGGFMMVFFICVIFLMSDKLYSPKELRNRYRLKILGTLPAAGDRKKNFIDAWLDRLEGKADGSQMAAEVELIGANIKNYAGDGKVLMIAGCADPGLVSRMTEQIQERLSGTKVLAGGNILQNAETLRMLPQCDGVVLVEQCKASTYSDVELEIERIRDLNKDVIGCVVFE